jgi:hypothetical protein
MERERARPLARRSTCEGHVQVAVAVKVHVHVHDQVNLNVDVSGGSCLKRGLAIASRKHVSRRVLSLRRHLRGKAPQVARPTPRVS